MIRAYNATAARMDAERYKLPAHKREKFFGGYKERSEKAQMIAALKALRGSKIIVRDANHDVIHELRGAPQDTWEYLIDAVLKEGVP